jgi:parvulin-like peptidyl-prolyl isomerase
MGWVADTALPAQYVRWVKSAKLGEVIGPIGVPQGWAILQVLGERPTPKPSLASVRSQLETALRNESLQAYVDRLKDSAHIVMHAKGADHALAHPKS